MPAPTTTLQAIQTKVRRLTRSPSQSQLTDTDLQNYINTFVVYDFPEQLRTFINKIPFNFWCNPYQDVYPLDIASFGGAANANLNTLYNFQNLYISVDRPLYIGGFNAVYSQSREQFFAIYPFVNSIQLTGFAGDGVTTSFTGFVNIQGGPNFVNPTLTNQTAVLIKNQVLFDSVDINGNGLAMVDVPILDSNTGNPTVWGNLYVAGTQPAVGPLAVAPYPLNAVAPNSSNYINYITGQYVVTFPTAPGVGQPINSQTVPVNVGIPQSMLFHDNHFTLRPVPDQPYQINFEVFQRPIALLASNQSPQLEEYWQYISYGAAKKIFEDRMDMESVQLIMPEFKTQERLCLRRTIVQNTPERTATIYTEQVSSASSQWGNGWSPF